MLLARAVSADAFSLEFFWNKEVIRWLSASRINTVIDKPYGICIDVIRMLISFTKQATP